MANTPITREQFFDLLPVALSLVRKPMKGSEAKKFAETHEAGKSKYERAQGASDPDGVTKKVGKKMIRAGADAAERRRRKNKRKGSG
jgi:hypothetical protein